MSVFPSFGRASAEGPVAELGLSPERLKLFGDYMNQNAAEFNLSTFPEKSPTDVRPSYLLPDVAYVPIEIPDTQTEPPKTLEDIYKDAPLIPSIPLVEKTETYNQAPMQETARTEPNINNFDVEPQKIGISSLSRVLPAIRMAKQAVISARSKVSDAYIKANIKLSSIDLSATAERFKEIKEKPNSKKIAVAAGVGLLAVGAAFAAYKYGYSGGNTSHTHEAVQQLQPKTPHQVLETARVAKSPAIHPAKHAVKAAVKIKEIKESLSFSGDTVWHHVAVHLQAKLGHMPSNDLIHKVTGKVLRDNGLTWVKATHLPKGTLIHIQEKFLTFKHVSAKISS